MHALLYCAGPLCENMFLHSCKWLHFYRAFICGTCNLYCVLVIMVILCTCIPLPPISLLPLYNTVHCFITRVKILIHHCVSYETAGWSSLTDNRECMYVCYLSLRLTLVVLHVQTELRRSLKILPVSIYCIYTLMK